MRRNSSSDETSLKLISNGYHGLSKCYQHTKQNHLVLRLITSTECFLRKTLLVLEKKIFCRISIDFDHREKMGACANVRLPKI